MSKVAKAAKYELVDDLIFLLVIITIVILFPITPIIIIIGTNTLWIQNRDWFLWKKIFFYLKIFIKKYKVYSIGKNSKLLAIH
jgi:hypothetical protein